MVKLLKENDLLYISNFSSLGGGYKEVEEQWRFLTKTKNVDVVLIDIPQIDTRKGKSGYGLLIADTVLAMLEYVADEENSLRKMRQKELLLPKNEELYLADKKRPHRNFRRLITCGEIKKYQRKKQMIYVEFIRLRSIEGRRR